ncbi:peptidoglycan DD-metalloendopeptidase family protein [Chitiniphilus purpureus]|uniref:Peptidoglycan DD-metalloendopeptidase family protein n=1 Tax=Chitiniphilus purpureus TaxID=2981137 RepID=A0ABY6DRH0_9NEIS|nr:peptidoglycan DD-metalloendopeptidase family protein [Chitiniphilus sp. CD1]UXY16622.1 peptidoglycan DD-metalloendopeptidase family protein [Chitiniphilus sp. CD1]
MLLLPGVATAAPEVSRADSKARQAELQTLRSRINALKQELAANESNRKQAADALKQSESAISDANRVLASLVEERQLTAMELARLEADIAGTRANIRASQTRLAQLLRTRYKTRELEAWRLILDAEDPTQASRDLTYYRHLATAQQQLAETLERQLAELNRLSEAIRRKNEELQQIARAKAQQKAALESQQAQKAELVARLSQEIGQQRNQIEKLAADEKRLGTLVARLNQLIRQQEAKRAKEAARLRAQREQRAKAAANTVKGQRNGSGVQPPAAEPVRQVNRDEPEQGQAGLRFAGLKGKLRLPLKGEVIGRFGSTRAEGTLWKGVFIRAAGGQPVKAVANGEVVFADWLRGFGNLIILDHGGGYLSLYAANESLLKEVGDRVAPGDTIATSGNSGGMADSGVYFEIRKNGQPLDPLSWTG